VRGATTYRPRSSLAMRAIEWKFSVISRSEILRSNSASTASMRLTGRARRDCSGKDRHQGDGAGRIVNVTSIVGYTGYSGLAVCAAAIRHRLTFDPVMIFKILVIPALTISKRSGAVPLARRSRRLQRQQVEQHGQEDPRVTLGEPREIANNVIFLS
jgi:hypothetical protein